VTLTKRTRLDAELVRRGLAVSRAEARRVIEAGLVALAGRPAKASTLVAPTDPITLSERPRFVSRGGDKLDGALARLALEVAGRRWLDAGASTGGFTDRLLQGGAAAVIAVDVGYGQLDWRLRNDDRVTVLERTNVRYLEPADLPFAPDAAVADLSFISLRLVLPALVAVVVEGGDFVLLVKPQFEAGRGQVGRGGVVHAAQTWRATVTEVVAAARALGLGLAGCVPSYPPGPAGNHEFFVHLRAGAQAGEEVIDAAITEVSG
jgi:23S rRNA (cytidine1920-2'-O)/16S rRNA (cytidine1409-2'-O)-methyltransferase